MSVVLSHDGAQEEVAMDTNNAILCVEATKQHAM